MPSEIYKKGSKGETVKLIQKTVGVKPDGDFGVKTELAVKKWQKLHGLKNDGIVGPATMSAMGIPALTQTTLTAEQTDGMKIKIPSGLILNQHYLKDGEFYEKKGQINKYVFLHHTAGANNPYAVVDAWSKDKNGRVATEFVIGGLSINNSNTYDGQVVECFKNRDCWAYHLGISSPSDIGRTSVGIEICNYGYLTEDCLTYKKKKMPDSQVVELKSKFRGHKKYHRYSDEQLKSLKLLLLHIADRDNIDIREGLQKWIKEKGEKAFEYSADAFNGNVKGLLTHANVRKDKSDCFPQQELMDMILTL